MGPLIAMKKAGDYSRDLNHSQMQCNTMQNNAKKKQNNAKQCKSMQDGLKYMENILPSQMHQHVNKSKIIVNVI